MSEQKYKAAIEEIKEIMNEDSCHATLRNVGEMLFYAQELSARIIMIDNVLHRLEGEEAAIDERRPDMTKDDIENIECAVDVVNKVLFTHNYEMLDSAINFLNDVYDDVKDREKEK